MASMSETEKRRFKLRMRINQGRKANRVEVEEEYKRNNDPNYGKELNSFIHSHLSYLHYICIYFGH